nr:immunoglobulin heavy chain junction region [Macaca mulatta]MOW87412.1 immunoglobulin heavy chain junction region [Macaca mulatta]MOW87574.1 immunoglobulin heavy chain junction region [Macaca mulatta]MOW88667.1 immunoglobulin heavy chain junction region [Macaca mulatta]MOW88731.1 immunoglobulin heavy chain junction region [Macaca mulatta]
CVRQDSNYDSW